MLVLIALALAGAPINLLPPSVFPPIAADAAHLPYLPTVPGADNPAVTQANIKSNICKPNWTKTVRPPTSYTNKLKQTLMLTLHLPGKAADYELDHETPIETGGDPGYALGPNGLPLNLWMMPYAEPYGARTKDKLETFLKHRICDGTVSLDEARHELQSDWIEAYTARIGPLP